MRILGVDPGLTRCGFGVIDSAANRTASFVDVGVIRSAPELALDQRLKLVGDGIAEVLDRHRPEVVSLERVFA
ncbi:MAG: crossover junction endodeoxyribonuclease RuvC, partial [Agromyces sp.]